MSKLPQISRDFIEESKLCQTMPKSKSGGPYSTRERTIRRNEVYRLHFDYGYSARKISELMKISRGTINSDIDFWYSKTKTNIHPYNPRDVILSTLERLNFQRTRLREQIDKIKYINEKITVERLLFDIDSKIWYINQRLVESSIITHGEAVQWMNKWLKQHGSKERTLTYFDTMKVSKKAKEKIDRTIKEDKSRNPYW